MTIDPEVAALLDRAVLPTREELEVTLVDQDLGSLAYWGAVAIRHPESGAQEVQAFWWTVMVFRYSRALDRIAALEAEVQLLRTNPPTVDLEP